MPSITTSRSSSLFSSRGHGVRFRIIQTSLRTVALAISLSALTGCVVAEEEPEPQSTNVKRMFASAQLVSGNLGGLTGADALCTSWANAADLGGSWKAFLSAAGINASSRIAEAGPWYNVTRQYKMFNNKSGFTVGAINPIRTEYNATASGNAWTGTKADGTADDVHCGNWTSSEATFYGSAGTPSETLSKGALWMSKGGNAPVCGSSLRVYCFEQ